MCRLTPVLANTLAGGGFVVQDEMTALHKAAANGHSSTANALVVAGADVNASDKVIDKQFWVLGS